MRSAATVLPDPVTPYTRIRRAARSWSLTGSFCPPVGLRAVRIARFTADDDPTYGVVGGDEGDEIVAVLVGDPIYAGIELTGEQHKLADVRLLAPVIPRSKVVCVGRNYAAHAEELGHDLPEEPLIFLKPNTSVIGPFDPIVYPSQSTEVHYEGELAVVIARICRDVPVERAGDVIYGYTVGNDVTARDLQNKDGQWARAKGFDSFCPLGPWIETELDPADLRVTTQLNGQVKQDGRTNLMMHDIPTVIAYVTSFMTLLPGDVILTGTPAGVGPMQPGDDVSVTVEGIGTLTNKVVSRD
jgi:2-keto-4-pentenoate hydratase/2-oxohepta-3-ene-1,7-dioic acid hydratase in catechol pathway